jgi:hypothetical protein
MRITNFSKTFLRLAAVGSAHCNSSRVTLLLLFTIGGWSGVKLLTSFRFLSRQHGGWQ